MTTEDNGMVVDESGKHHFGFPELTPDRVIRWEPTGDEDNPRSRLSTNVHFCGYFMHLEAWELTTNEHGEQVSVFCPEDFEHIFDFDGRGRFQTMRIEGRDYALIMIPGSA